MRHWNVNTPLILLSGCTAAVGPSPGSTELADELTTPAAEVGEVDDGLRFSFRAVGSGCRSGTWTEAKQSGCDGATTPALRFNSFSLDQGGGRLQARDCNIGLQVQPDDTDTQFALVEATLRGRAELVPGVRGEVVTNVGFTGARTASASSQRLTLEGPWGVTNQEHGESFSVVVRPELLDWSPCNTSRRIEVNATLFLYNHSTGDSERSAQTGRIAIEEFGGIKIASRPCR